MHKFKYKGVAFSIKAFKTNNVNGSLDEEYGKISSYGFNTIGILDYETDEDIQRAKKFFEYVIVGVGGFKTVNEKAFSSDEDLLYLFDEPDAPVRAEDRYDMGELNATISGYQNAGYKMMVNFCRPEYFTKYPEIYQPPGVVGFDYYPYTIKENSESEETKSEPHRGMRGFEYMLEVFSKAFASSERIVVIQGMARANYWRYPSAGEAIGLIKLAQEYEYEGFAFFIWNTIHAISENAGDEWLMGMDVMDGNYADLYEYIKNEV